MVSARWSSSGIGFNGAGLSIFGETEDFRIKWGHGPDETVSLNRDTDGDGVFDTADIFHEFPSDGNYDIAVYTSPGIGVPPVRLKAFMHASETDSITLGGSHLQDIMISGTGNDELRGGGADDWLSAGDGADKLYGQGGNDLLLGGGGADFLYGSVGVDLLAGQDGDDMLYGQDDTDFIYGETGADTLFGGNGDDYLDGGAGIDRLKGEAGADTFVIAPFRDEFGTVTLQDDPARDFIVDFQQGVDHIDMTGWGPMTFIGTDAFSGDRAEIRYRVNGANTIIYGDYDGDAKVDFSVTLGGVYTLTEPDIWVAYPADMMI